MTYEKAVENLLYWQRGQHFFTCELYSLMQKADKQNFDKLAQVYPMEASAFYSWYTCQDPDEFFKNNMEVSIDET